MSKACAFSADAEPVATLIADGPTLQMIGAIPFVMPPGQTLAWYNKVALKEAVEAERKGDTRKAQRIIAKLERDIGTTAAHVIEATRGHSFSIGRVPDHDTAEPVERVRLTTTRGPGRPPSAGERYRSGELKPVGPNETVAMTRLALLIGPEQAASRRWTFLATEGGFLAVGTDSRGKQQRVDLRPADNALDLARARGWLSEERHRAAAAYERLFRHVLSLPALRCAAAPSDRAIGAMLSADGGRAARSGFETEIDAKLRELAKQLEAGKISEAHYTRAEKQHRASAIDWSRVPDKVIAAIFDAAADLHVSAASLEHADPEFAKEAQDRRQSDVEHLRAIWRRTTPEQARELFGACLAGSWPQWINQRAAGHTNTRWERSRVLLEAGLDAVIAVLGEASVAKRPKASPADPPPPPPPAVHGPIREERRLLVDQDDGSLIREIIVRTRRREDPQPS